jgi:hypothetical protein
MVIAGQAGRCWPAKQARPFRPETLHPLRLRSFLEKVHEFFMQPPYGCRRGLEPRSCLAQGGYLSPGAISKQLNSGDRETVQAAPWLAAIFRRWPGPGRRGREAARKGGCRQLFSVHAPAVVAHDQLHGGARPAWSAGSPCQAPPFSACGVVHHVQQQCRSGPRRAPAKAGQFR